MKLSTRIWNLLKSKNAYTKQTAISIKSLALTLNVDATGTAPEIRAAVKELRCRHYRPVISCSRGIYITDNIDEITEYKNNLLSRIAGIHENIKGLDAILRTWDIEKTGLNQCRASGNTNNTMYKKPPASQFLFPAPGTVKPKHEWEY